MRTPEQYRESLRRMRPNVHKFGELIEDVTTHPATRRAVEGHARLYEAALEKGTAGLLTTTSSLTGTCTGGRCVGWSAINAMWATTFDVDRALGTDYHGRLRDWLVEKQGEDIALCGALTDPKGDRGLGPGDQPEPDLNLRAVAVRDDGIVVRGPRS